jgi:tetratricopeptide (TPR) repeat protein
MRAPWVAAGLAVAMLVAWHPLLENDFVDYDDDLYVTNSPQVRAGLTSDGLAWAFTSFHGANWFPLTRISWLLDSELFGMDPRAFHRTSLALHAAGALLLLAALFAMSGALWRSALAAAIFALHPLQVEAVAWASARKDVLSGLFFALVLLAWTRYARDGRRLHYALAALALALGLLAKQMLVTLPFALLLFDAWPLGRLRDPASGRLSRSRLRRAVVEKLPLLAIAAAAAVVVVLAQRSGGAIQSLDVIPLELRVANAGVAYAAYLGDAIWPSGLAVFYPYDAEALTPARVGAAALLLGLATGLALGLSRRLPWLAVGWLFFVGTLVPVIGLVQLGQAARADRYMYLPLIGLALAAAWGLGELAARGRSARALSVGLALAALLGLGAATNAQVRTWRDSEALFEHALRVTRDNHVAHLDLGLAYLNAGRLDEAAQHLETALRLAPASTMARGILGELRLRQRRWPDAAASFRSALESGDRDAARWRAGLGQALFELGELEASVESYRRALRGRTGAAAVHANLGLALAALGRHREAIESYREALRLDPGLAEAHGNLGISLVAQGEEAEGVEHLERAVALDAGLAVAHAHLGEALARRGATASALERLDEAVRLRPRDPGLRAARGRVREQAGLGAGALEDYRAALDAGERGPMLLNNLAWLLATSADPVLRAPAEAVAYAEEAAAASSRRIPEILDTLAVAYAAAGRRADARAAAEEALARAERRGQTELATRIRGRLATWEAERADGSASRRLEGGGG